MLEKLQNLPPGKKTFIAISNDFFFAGLCFYTSLILRHGTTSIPNISDFEVLLIVFGVMLIQVSTFYFMGIYKGVWRYSSTFDLIRLIKGCTVAVAFSLIGIFLYNRLSSIPRTAFIIDWLLLIITLGGARLAYRLLRDYKSGKSNNKLENLIIVGAGDLGDQLFREIRKSPEHGVRVVGFIDDSPNIKGKYIHGVPVLGNLNDLDEIISLSPPQRIYVTLTNPSVEDYKKIVSASKGHEIVIKKIPKMTANLNAIAQLRNIGPEDLLGREEVKLDLSSVGKMLSNKNILVTGAGGSIGSELCHQIAMFEPAKLILIDQSEFNLYSLENSLQSRFPNIKFEFIVADVRKKDYLSRIFSEATPQIIFHAAAYKHVPIMERNPWQAIHTNIVGTQNVCELAIEYKAERFVLVSTDKAVNPTNVMGATKRIAEMVCLFNQTKGTTTKFMMVRFGNVLGSSGSVIPLFKEQIQNGGPVTVTHPDVERFFMSIPEASRLVIQAGAIGNGGEIFVLDMGSPVKIKDLASQMIEMSGLRVNQDINIIYTGLRPGEKLFEELLMNDENILPTLHPLVKVAKSRTIPEQFDDILNNLLSSSPTASVEDIKKYLQLLVPEYKPATNSQKDLLSIESPSLDNIQ